MDFGKLFEALICSDAQCTCRHALERGFGLVHCPNHDDRRPSLSVRLSDDGRILLKCHAGCPNDEIIETLRRRGLWPSREPAERRETRYEVRNADGQLVAIHVRIDTPTGKRLWWELPNGRRGLNGLRLEDLPLYGIERLGDATDVTVVEGEKAAEALIRLGLPAVGTVTGASATPSMRALRPLASRRVYLWPDNDEPGRAHMRRIAEALAELGCERIFVVNWSDAPEGGDAADFVAHGGTVEDVRKLLASAQPWEDVSSTDAEQSRDHKTQKATAFKLAHMSDLLSEPEEKVSWLVEGILPMGGISLLAAKPKVGKSTTARCLALSVARGEPFLDRPTTPGVVVYLALEEKRAEVIKHFRQQGANESDPIYVHVGMAPADALEALAEIIAMHRPVLVIIDPLLKFVRMRDVNDYAEASRALEPVIELARQTGTHLLFIHHLAKSERAGGDGILGSTAIFGAVDTAILMRRHQDGTRTIETVQRYGVDLPESVIVLDEVTGRVALEGTVHERKQAEAERTILDVLGTDPMTEPEIREAAQLKGIVVNRALRSLVERGVLERIGTGRRGDPFRYRFPEFSSRSSRSSLYVPGRAGRESEMGQFSASRRQEFSSHDGQGGHGSAGREFSESPSSVSGNGSTPRCPVCRQPYELRATDRPDWWQLKCRCTGGDWHWVRANDPALRGAHP